MDIQISTLRSGFDGQRCLVHARCCETPKGMIATAQYLDIAGCDLFSGIYMSLRTGEAWSEFLPQPGLAPIDQGDTLLTGCDATPMYHRKTGKILLLGHTAQYRKGSSAPTGKARSTFYSVYDPVKNTFGEMRLLSVPQSFGGEYGCGNGSGQSVEADDGTLLIPVYFKNADGFYASCVMHCAFDGENLHLLKMGEPLNAPLGRGLYEPSLVYHQGMYYMTLRSDEFGALARSADGLHFTDLQLWKWQDGSLLETYNTQQHWLTLEEQLYLVYTRRCGSNNHVFRHRAPLFIAQVEDMKLIRDSERSLFPERGARLGNFGITQLSDGSAAVMAAEWMQPAGCEARGSDNTIFLAAITP